MHEHATSAVAEQSAACACVPSSQELQGVQLAAPAVAAKELPSLQRVQLSSPALAAEPAGHTEQTLAPSAEDVPLGQSAHEAAPGAVERWA